MSSVTYRKIVTDWNLCTWNHGTFWGQSCEEERFTPLRGCPTLLHTHTHTQKSEQRNAPQTQNVCWQQHSWPLERTDNMKKSSLPSRLFHRSPASCETPSSAKYQRHVDCTPNAVDDSGPKDRWPRNINFALRPETYEPLTDEGAKETKRRRRKESYKKVRKVGLTWIIFFCSLNKHPVKT